ncbi:MAG: 50S ribosomal protein L9 [Gaiellaceae bacterium]
MNVILLQDVDNLGLRGDVVSVARGYARNFLIPRKLAEVATTAKVEELRKRDARRTLQEARSGEQAETIAETLRKTVLRFEMKAGPTGALFGSVTPSDIADEIWRVRKIRIDRRKIELPDPLKRIGTHLVPIQIFEGVSVEVKTLVVPEGGELPPEQEPAEQQGGEQEPQGAAEAEAEAPSAEPVLEPVLEAEDEGEAAS